MRVIAAPLVVIALAACATSQPVRAIEAPVELNVPPIGALPRVVDAPSAQDKCTLALQAGPITKSAIGCILDERISTNAGALYYPCHGDGPAEAIFGDQRFAGVVRHGEVDLESKTELEWDGDHCRWGTTATIKGPLTKGTEGAKGTIVWSYVDYVVRGTGCSGSCRAAAVFNEERELDD